MDGLSERRPFDVAAPGHHALDLTDDGERDAFRRHRSPMSCPTGPRILNLSLPHGSQFYARAGCAAPRRPSNPT